MAYSDPRMSWQPETYAEMGAAVPFTAPELTGARARGAGKALELTLPNPSGRRGIYILDPREMARFCVPTLHDRHLAATIAKLPEVTPSSVRQAAQTSALGGLAGREAAAAARAAQDADQHAALSAQLGLLRLLVAQMGGGSEAAGLDRAAKTAIDALAARTGRKVTAVTHVIEVAAQLSGPVGLPGNTQARHPALLAAIGAMAEAVRPYTLRDHGRATRAAALIVSAADDAVALAGTVLAEARRRFGDVPGLVSLCLTGAGAAATTTLAARLDWLLDGWPAICHVWRLAAPGRACAALNEMALMVPFVPVEAASWAGRAVNEAARQSLRAEMVGFTDWRAGHLAYELLARNECLRGLAA
jgi:hypothetical protein